MVKTENFGHFLFSKGLLIPIKIDPSKKRYKPPSDFMIEKKGNDFYGGVGNYQIFKGTRFIILYLIVDKGEF